MKKILLVLFAIFFCSTQSFAQDVLINFVYDFSQAVISEPPKLTTRPNLVYPETAKRNGVEGTVKISLTLGADGQIKDVQLISGLPFGVSERAIAAAQNIKFIPAQKDGKPVSVPMTITFEISLTYKESNKDVIKPKITAMPAPVYPEKYRADKLKGKARVRIEFSSDGTLKVLDVSSAMSKEFAEAALEAAKQIKFEPAVHKKTKKPVTQTLTVEYEFKQ